MTKPKQTIDVTKSNGRVGIGVSKPRIREVIRQQVEDGISPSSIIFSVGRLVTPDEAEYLRAYLNENT